MINAEILRELLAYDPVTGLFAWRKSVNSRAITGSVAGTPAAFGHRKIGIAGRSYLAHRLAWMYVHGMWPTEQIDHRNGNPDDNSIANLRLAAGGINQQNQRRPNSKNKCGFLGVRHFRSGGKFAAQIFANGKRKHLGVFSTPQAGHEAYLSAKRRLHPGCTI